MNRYKAVSNRLLNIVYLSAENWAGQYTSIDKSLPSLDVTNLKNALNQQLILDVREKICSSLIDITPSTYREKSPSAFYMVFVDTCMALYQKYPPKRAIRKFLEECSKILDRALSYQNVPGMLFYNSFFK